MTSAGDAVIRIGPPLAIAVAILAVVAIGVNCAGSTGLARATATATGRAVVQLAALAAVLGLVVHALWASVTFVALMAVAAAWTSSGRVLGGRGTPSIALRCLLPVCLPAIVAVLALTVAGILPVTGLAIIPTAGILFGGAMNATSLAGRRARDELHTRRGEVEAALSLGLLPRDARIEIIRPAATTALIPALDQTRSVGLVTIPGAFVGMVLGGASTTAAAVMQLFVLIALLVVSSIAVVVTTELVCREEL